ncbi:Smr/MutS family protein [Patescibacteria group bacterium]|nr:Smr/MutS family protein [Patescibacteria group bacterium]MBU1034412.1 Smr/MutS family protein [Patescibacteria group bacterium]MBU1630068.1 Smr/MutS family protein [Patescibacteria group bacterium]MBU1908210.1 Smr/MutS family protein [Patescibacteria group bacterium]
MYEKNAQQSPAIADHEAAIFAAELGEAPEIDLHGLTTEEAINRLETFLHHEFMHGTETVKIIHGRGEEILRKAVQKTLTGHPLVEYSRGSNNPKQAGAVTFAVLARKG